MFDKKIFDRQIENYKKRFSESENPPEMKYFALIVSTNYDPSEFDLKMEQFSDLDIIQDKYEIDGSKIVNEFLPHLKEIK